MTRLGAAVATAAAVYLAIGVVTGRAPALGRRSGPRTTASDGHARPGGLQELLVQAGIGVGPVTFTALSAACGVLVFAVGAGLTSAPAVAIAPGCTAAALPRAWVGRRRQRRLREVTQAWPDGLRELIGAVTAGMSLSQALSALAHTGPEPLRLAFGRFPALVRMTGVVPALELIRAELADPTSDRVIEVLVVAHERGGSIVIDLLRDLAEATTEDLRTEEEIATAGLEQRINARVVFVLPWLVLLALTASPGAFREFYRTSGGLVVVGVAALASLAGAWLVGRLARDPVEPRVLADRSRGPA